MQKIVIIVRVTSFSKSRYINLAQNTLVKLEL